MGEMAIPYSADREQAIISGNDQLFRLGGITAAYRFLEARALQQLKHTPPKEELVQELLNTRYFVERAQTTQDVAFHQTLEETKGILSEGIRAYVGKLERKTAALQMGLLAQENAVKSTNPETVRLLKVRLTETDEDTKQSMEDRVRTLAARFSGKVQIVTDGDGTLTVNPHDYLQYIPGSLVAEARLKKHGREESFLRVFAQDWQEPLEMFPHLFELVGREFATVREGVFPFFKEAKQNGIPPIILTANFEPVTLGFLEQNPSASDGVFVLAVKPEDVTSIDKKNVIKRLAYDSPQNPIIYIGDGETDKGAAEAESDVLVYFALEGSSFEQRLKTNGLRYFSYNTFTNIGDKLREIGLFANAAQPS